MKAKLVKYPFNEKKYRWDSYKLGKEFEYYWDESLPNNFETIEPYIEFEDFNYDSSKEYAYIDIGTGSCISEPISGKVIPSPAELKPKFYPDISYWVPGHGGTWWRTGDYWAIIYRKQNDTDIFEDTRYICFENNGTLRIETYTVGGAIPQPSSNETIIGCFAKAKSGAKIHYTHAGNVFNEIPTINNIKDQFNSFEIGYGENMLGSQKFGNLTQDQYNYIKNECPLTDNLWVANKNKANKLWNYIDGPIGYNLHTSWGNSRINYFEPNILSFWWDNSLADYIYIEPEYYMGILNNTSVYQTKYYNANIAVRLKTSFPSGTNNQIIRYKFIYHNTDNNHYAFRESLADNQVLYDQGNPNEMIDISGNYCWISPHNPNLLPQCCWYMDFISSTNYDLDNLPSSITKNSYIIIGGEDIDSGGRDQYISYSGYSSWVIGCLSDLNYRFANSHLTLSNDFLQLFSNKFKTLKENVILIGDKTDSIITIPQNNTNILEYTLGEGVNGNFVPKTLQVNAPCEYENGVVSSRTWLTFNSYTAAQWQNGFHFEGAQWNNIGSPFAYLNAITSPTGNRKMVYTYEPAETGTYVNLFSLINGGFEVSDSLDNDYIALTDTLSDYRHYYDDNVGSLWYFGSGVVSSTDRNAYPDEGSQGDFTYLLRPQDTKFLRYYRVRDELTNVELYSDRYTYTHNTVDFYDASWQGRTIGTTTSTNEESVPDGTWREYLGLYLGTSIPFLGIVETEIPPADILGVPQYDKQVNTSDTLKYGTVASASLTFTLNKPVGETLTHNNELLILYYDFKHRDEWERLGFFRVDSIEALDENTTSLMAHDEVYKLNKYVDDFLEAYTQTTTLDLFYRDLLNYCGCFYDTHQDIIHNGSLGMTNVYHAVKTTGVQVAHYVANLSPGFIHANIDGDVVLQQYQLKDDNLTIADYSNLVYTAYNTDMLNKIKIVSSNAVKGEDNGTGTNVYFLADNPLLSELQATSYFNALAQDILEVYEEIPTYRPATVDFLILPRELKIGDIVNLTTPKNETYKVIVMAMNISSSGLQIKSFGTQSYPVEAESNSEFVNLINDMGEISGDVSNMMEAQRTMANAIAENTEHIGDLQASDTAQNSTISNHSTQIGNLQTLTSGFGVSVASNLATIALNGSTPNVAMKGYVDNTVSTGDTNTLNCAKSYTDAKFANLLAIKTGTLTFKQRYGTGTNTCNVLYLGNEAKTYGFIIPQSVVVDTSGSEIYNYDYHYYFTIYNGTYKSFYRTGVSGDDWFYNDISNPVLTVS